MRTVIAMRGMRGAVGAWAAIGIAAVAMVVVALVAAGFGYYAGRHQGLSECEQCAKIDPAVELKAILAPAAKLAVVHVGTLLEQPFDIPPQGAFTQWLAHALSPLVAERSHGHFRYFASYLYGYDLGDRSAWDLTREGDTLVFHAPPLALLSCPAVNLETLFVEFDQRSILVNESEQLPEVQRMLTRNALRHAEMRLVGDFSRARIREEAEKKLRELIAALASGIGWKLTPDQVKIVYAREYDAERWTDKDPEDKIEARLARYGCR